MADQNAADPAPRQPPAAASRPGRDRKGAPLPVPPTSFVGREREAGQVRDLLRCPGVRLVTLTGPGGVGKTRLALRAAGELARDFPDGVAWVDLAPLADPDLVTPAVARALGLAEAEGSASDRLAAALRDRQLLLVLDNVEQVAQAAPAFGRLLVSCPGLVILATSREPLRLAAERVVLVPPLALAGSGTESAPADAVRLFAERARAVRADFALTSVNAPAVAAVCARLDGLPLAIELAAARVAHLPPAALLRRLERALPLLTGGPRDAPARQQTMRDAIAWSHDLLAPDEQLLFRRLGIFVGGFALGAAAATTATDEGDVLDGIAALVVRNLLHAEEGPGGEPRYRMLETIREFALERLVSSGEAEAIRDAHASHCLALAEAAKPALLGSRAGEWLRRLDPERDNLRAALGWLEARGRTAELLRMAAALTQFWNQRGDTGEGTAWLSRALARAGAAPTPDAVEAVLFAGLFAHYRGEIPRGMALLTEGRALAGRLGEPRRIGEAECYLGITAADRGEYDRADAHLAAALERFVAVDWLGAQAVALAQLGVAAYGRGDHGGASAWFDRAAEAALADGYRVPLEVVALYRVLLACERSDWAEAAARLREALALLDPGDAEGLTRLAPAAGMLGAATGEGARAARLFGGAEALREEVGLAPALPERAAYDWAVEGLRAGLGAAAFEAERAAGRALSRDGLLAEIAAVAEAAEVRSRSRTAGRGATRLTPREREVLRLLAAGRSNPEIAEALFIGPRTAQTHVANLLAKLGAASRAEAAARAVRDGLVWPPRGPKPT